MDENELREYGHTLAYRLEAGDVIALTGELGAGKTTLTKAIAEGLGVTDTVTSPTFTLINEYYSGRLPLFHFDVYRLTDASELETLGYEEYFFGKGVTVIEWADLVSDYIPDTAIKIKIERGNSDDDRVLTEN